MIGRLLAVDWGDKRIGLAVSDELGMLASPAGTIVRRVGKRPPLAELMRQAEALNATAYVFGLPLDEQGVDTARCEEVRGVAATLASRQALPVRLVDERFTTSAALRSIRAQGGSTRGRKDDVDALAACILLEGVLRASKQGVTLGELVAPPHLGSESTSAPRLGSESNSAPRLGSESTSAPRLGSESNSEAPLGSESSPSRDELMRDDNARSFGVGSKSAAGLGSESTGSRDEMLRGDKQK